MKANAFGLADTHRYYNEIESSNSCEQESNQHETALLADLINSLSSQVSEAQTKIDLTHKQSASLQKQVCFCCNMFH